jgi:peptide deformylase
MSELSAESNTQLEVITLGHSGLCQTAMPVDDLQSPEIQQLIDQLIRLTQERNGVGIAASQVGQPIQLMIIASRPTPRYPDAPMMQPTALVNPKIVAYSEAMDTDWEGCLSVPGLRGRVPRHRSVTVVYHDRQGIEQTTELTGFIARIFQHEYDHFQGIVFLDRVEAADAVVTEVVYQQMIAIGSE